MWCCGCQATGDKKHTVQLNTDSRVLENVHKPECPKMIKNKQYQYGSDDGWVPVHMHFGKAVYENMLENRHITAVINSETNESMTYAELAQRTADTAVSLARVGVRKGDVVTICSDKRFEVLPSMLGAMCAGATFSPTDISFGSFALLHRLKIGRPKVIFCSEKAFKIHKATFEEAQCIEYYVLFDNIDDDLKSGMKGKVVTLKEFIQESVDIDEFVPVPVDGWVDNLFIMFSSGTTGLSKGIPLTHLAFVLNSQCFVMESYKAQPILNTREWHYTYGMMFSISCLRAGATLVYSPTNTEETMLAAVQKYKVILIQLNPSTITNFIKAGILDKYDLRSLKQMMSASTPVKADIIDAMKEKLPKVDIVQLYGMSEAGAICCELRAPKGPKPGSSGLPCLGFIIKVVDLETRQPLGPNQRGEVCIKGPSVFNKYLGNVTHDYKDEEGFLKTGDIGYYDEDGYFYIVNRIKELMKYNDLAIAPAEFEAILLSHPAVRDVGVVGMKHPKHGDAPVAFVVLQPGAKVPEQELVDYLNSRVTHLTPLAGGVRFLDKLPEGGGGKLDRKALKEMLE